MDQPFYASINGPTNHATSLIDDDSLVFMSQPAHPTSDVFGFGNGEVSGVFIAMDEGLQEAYSNWDQLQQQQQQQQQQPQAFNTNNTYFQDEWVNQPPLTPNTLFQDPSPAIQSPVFIPLETGFENQQQTNGNYTYPSPFVNNESFVEYSTPVFGDHSAANGNGVQSAKNPPPQQQQVANVPTPALPVAAVIPLQAKIVPATQVKAVVAATAAVVPASRTQSPPKPATTVTGPPLSRSQLITKQACIPCRRLKASCDEQRPCSRCVRFCRECVDRTEAEIEEAKIRRKRVRKSPAEQLKIDFGPTKEASKTTGAAAATSNGVTSAQPITATIIRQPSSSQSSNVQASCALYSRSILKVLKHLGVRDLMLHLHAQMENLPSSIVTALQWPTQSTLMCMYLADSMTVDDFQTFISEGLTPEQLQSTNYLTAEFIPWARPSTRPMYYTWQAVKKLELVENMIQKPSPDFPAPNNSFYYQPPPTASDDFDQLATLAQMKVEWLPQASAAMRRWESMYLMRMEFDRQVRAMKHGNDTSSNLSKCSQNEKDCATRLIQLAQLSTATEQINSVDELTNLVDGLGCLAIGRGLTESSEPSPSEPISLQHASWCPQSRLDLEEATNAESQSKKQSRQEGMTSVHSASTASTSSGSSNPHTPDSTDSSVNSNSSNGSSSNSGTRPGCVCELSTPLPARVIVNSSFERLFGWSQREIELGLMREGMSFMRHLYPASIWVPLQMAQVTQWKMLCLALSQMATKVTRILQQYQQDPIAAATATTSDDDDPLDAVRNLPPPHVSHVVHTQLLNKFGAILPCTLRKRSVPYVAGDPNSTSGYISTWEVQTTPITIENWTSTHTNPLAPLAF